MKTETRPKVLILKGRDYRRLIPKALRLFDPERTLSAGKTVFVKPNWVSDNPRLLTTHPDLLEALVRFLVGSGAKRVLVGDNPTIGLPSRHIYKNTDWGKRIEAAGGQVAFLDETPYTSVPLADGFPWKEIPVPTPILESDIFINVPVAKTHSQGVLSLGIKNLIGVLNDEWKSNFHREDLHYKAVAVLSVLRPHLTIIDGMTAGEGQGPAQCDPVQWGTLFLGDDPVATDAVCSTCMGYEPAEVHTTRIASSMGLGEADPQRISLGGKKIREVFRPFKRAILGISGRYPCEVVVSGACEGCIAWVQARMDRWQEEGIWPEIARRRKLVLAVGRHARLTRMPDPGACTVIAFGDCVPEETKAHPGAVVVPGCPPTANIGPILDDLLLKIGVR
jgi:uncharacterized protein (DUF362 family)